MNNYDYYGINIPNEMSIIPDMNNMIKDMNYMTNNFTMPYNNINNQMPMVTNPNTGFIRGNMFENLYNPYKNYTPYAIKSNNEQEKMLNKIREYKFALVDLDLYLDTHPNNTEMVNLYNVYLMEEKKLCNEYERLYGPLSLSSNYLNNTNWEWINSTWPWEGNK